jgi:F0F1-type ATP synthase membrane subunit b/b'
MSVNFTMNALANILKPEGGPMDIETVQKTEGQKEEEKKAYEARIEATKVPTPDELAARVCSQAKVSSIIGSNLTDHNLYLV